METAGDPPRGKDTQYSGEHRNRSGGGKFLGGLGIPLSGLLAGGAPLLHYAITNYAYGAKLCSQTHWGGEAVTMTSLSTASKSVETLSRKTSSISSQRPPRLSPLTGHVRQPLGNPFFVSLQAPLPERYIGAASLLRRPPVNSALTRRVG